MKPRAAIATQILAAMIASNDSERWEDVDVDAKRKRERKSKLWARKAVEWTDDLIAELGGIRSL